MGSKSGRLCAYGDDTSETTLSSTPIMPIVPVKTRSGLVHFNCKISTPTTTDANALDPSLPTILFMHGPYLPQIAFQSKSVLKIPSCYAETVVC